MQENLNQALVGRRVLIIVENLPVPFDRRVWQEARALRDAGAQVCIICPVGPGYEAIEEIVEGIQIYRHPLPTKETTKADFILEYICALYYETRLSWKVLLRHGFDTIHACNPPDLIFLVALQFKLLGKKFLFDHHDINPEFFEAKFGKRGFFWRLLIAAEWATFKLADVVVSTNESYREIALSRGGRKSEDVFVVRSGPDLTRVKKTSSNDVYKNGRKFLVGYVGVMGEPEGIDLLLEAVKYIIDHMKREDIQFVLIGSGPQLEALKKMSENMLLQKYVTFTGRAPDHVLFEVLSTSDLCVNPDRVNLVNDKSTMNKILEYMAFGKAIVQFDVKEGRVSAQQASLYAVPNDPIDFAIKIAQLLDDTALRVKMGEFGKSRVENQLAWRFEIPKLLAAYARIDVK